MSSALLKVPCIAAFTYANYIIWTPTNTSKPREQVRVQSLSERWIQIEIAGLGLIKNTFLALGIVESVPIILDAFSLSPSLTQRLMLSGNVTSLQPDNMSIIGLTFVILGTWLRYVCYKTMGRHYTFELSIRKGHQLVRNGPYSVVRHPAYTGIGIIYIGYLFWYLSPASWLRQSGVFVTIPGFLFFGPFTIFMIGNCLALLFGRAPREDQELRKAFGREWDEYARKVPASIVPGIW